MNILSLLGALGLSVVTSTNVVTTTTDSNQYSSTYKVTVNSYSDILPVTSGTTAHPSDVYGVTHIYVRNDGSTKIDKFGYSSSSDPYYINGNVETMYWNYYDDLDDYEDLNYGIIIRTHLTNTYTTGNTPDTSHIFTLDTLKLKAIYFQYVYFNKDNFLGMYTDCSSTCDGAFVTSIGSTFVNNVTTFISGIGYNYLSAFTSYQELDEMWDYTGFVCTEYSGGDFSSLDGQFVDDQWYMCLNRFIFGFSIDGSTPSLILLYDKTNSINRLADYPFTMTTRTAHLVTDIDSNNIYGNGFDDGYEAGYSDGQSYGYQDGYSEGYSDGQYYGYDNGYDTGYVDGMNEDNPYTFGALFGSIADTPILVVRSLFNFDFFGVNLLSVVLSLFTALILFYLLRKLL